MITGLIQVSLILSILCAARSKWGWSILSIVVSLALLLALTYEVPQ